ncbi:Uncharacterised protein [Achromobacter kerstersii]|nr:Uncharacterised protein [Achromobacter kerstersii]
MRRLLRHCFVVPALFSFIPASRTLAMASCSALRSAYPSRLTPPNLKSGSDARLSREAPW